VDVELQGISSDFYGVLEGLHGVAGILQVTSLVGDDKGSVPLGPGPVSLRGFGPGAQGG
jgi:hypothetical protein